MDPEQRAAYVAAVAAIERRKEIRNGSLRAWRFHEQVEERLQAAHERMAAAGWATEIAKLATYASPEMLAALDAAVAADHEARSRYTAWSTLADQNRHANAQAAAGLPARFVSSDVTMAAFNAIKPALEAANQADDTLVALIRAHLKA